MNKSFIPLWRYARLSRIAAFRSFVSTARRRPVPSQNTFLKPWTAPTRFQSAVPSPKDAPKPLPHRPAPHRNPQEPIYELTFTCTRCKTRSSHTVSKQGYHAGTVLITCPGCKNRHLIADHLKIFSDRRVTLDDILKEKGTSMHFGERKVGVDGVEGEIEFWGEEDIRKWEERTKQEQVTEQ